MSRPLLFVEDKSSHTVINGKKTAKNSLYHAMITFQWWRQWDNASISFSFSFYKTACSQWKKVQGKAFYTHSWSFLLYSHQEHRCERVSFVKYVCSFSSLGIEQWCLTHSFPSTLHSPVCHSMDLVESPQLAGFPITLVQVQISSVFLLHSFHAFPRKNVDNHSILKNEKKRKRKVSQFPEISQQRRVPLKFVLIIKRIIEMV